MGSRIGDTGEVPAGANSREALGNVTADHCPKVIGPIRPGKEDGKKLSVNTFGSGASIRLILQFF